MANPEGKEDDQEESRRLGGFCGQGAESAKVGSFVAAPQTGGTQTLASAYQFTCHLFWNHGLTRIHTDGHDVQSLHEPVSFKAIN